jgi:hypothetical protein
MAEVFTVKIDDKDTEFKVRRPTSAEQRESEKVYRRIFRESLQNGDFVRAKLDDELRRQGLWDDKKQAEHDLLMRKMSDNRKLLLKGGMKLSDAKNVALSIIDDRNKLLELLLIRNQLDALTAEAQAENAKFNYLVACCVVYNTTNKPFFKNLDEYLEKADSEVAIKGATSLMKLLMEIDEDQEKNSVESKFLRKWKFVDDEGRLVNKDGHFVDREGRLINDKGHYVDENGKRVDKDGNPVDDNGQWIFKEEPFLDDEGNPIVEEKTAEEPQPADKEEIVEAIEA